MTFDDELRSALRRVDPPAGFAARVSRRAAGEVPSREGPRPVVRGELRRPTRWVVGALAASLATVSVSGLAFLEYRRQAEARRAQALVIEALHVTSATLGSINARIADRARRDADGRP